MPDTRTSKLLLGLTALFLLAPSIPAPAAHGQTLLEKAADSEPLEALPALEAFVGDYATFAGSHRRVTISRDGDQLRVTDARGQGGILERLDPVTFGLMRQQQLTFEKAPDGGYESFRLARFGASTPGVQFRRSALLEAEYRETAGQLGPHALSNAVVMNDLVSAQALISAGADVDELDTRVERAGRNGRRPLNWAAQMGHAEMVSLLLDAGADLHLTNESGFTPLHHAAEASSADAARVLIERGANLEVETESGLTPLEIALRAPQGDVAELLQEALEKTGDSSDRLAEQPVYSAPEDLDDGLKVGTLSGAGADQEKVLDLLSNLARGAYQDVDSLLILQGGELVVEQYYGSWSADRPHPMQSVSKGITALLVGSALRQGHIESVSDPIAEYLPNHRQLLTGARAQITIEDLLTMSAGFDWNEHEPAYGQPGNIRFEEVTSKDAVAFTLERPHIHPRGQVFTYSGGYVTVVGEILVNATGAESVLDYLAQSTLAELGFGSHQWLNQADGRQNTAGGAMLRPRDLAKIGQMMIDGGMWNGKRLLDQDFVDQALAPKIEAPGGWNEYGYYWWGRTLESGSKSYEIDAALGWGGQELILIPDLDLVVVLTATNYRFPTPTVNILENFIVPAFQQSADSAAP